MKEGFPDPYPENEDIPVADEDTVPTASRRRMRRYSEFRDHDDLFRTFHYFKLRLHPLQPIDEEPPDR
jgi:hypothetical protein